MYVMDSARQRKVDVNGTVHQVGMPPPVIPPTVTIGTPKHKSIFSPVMDLAGWSNGPPFVCTFPYTHTDVSTTVTAILYDVIAPVPEESVGWCTIVPESIEGFYDGMYVQIGGTPYVVRDVVIGVSGTYNITATELLYDGLTQSIVISPITSDIKNNTILENIARGEFALIKAVAEGPDGKQCFLCKPPTYWAAGDPIRMHSSFRVYTLENVSVDTAILSRSLSVYVNVTDDSALSYTGNITSPSFAPPLDLTTFDATLSTTPDSYINIACALSNPDNVETIKVMFGCIDEADPDEAFNTNYFYKIITPADLSHGSDADNPNAFSAKGSTCISIKLAELIAVGSPTLKSIQRFRIEMTVRAPVTTNEYPGSRIFFGSLYLSGLTGPNVGSFGTDYIYRYRARCSSTGVVSNWSPASLQPVNARGESVTITVPSQYLLAPEADMIDFQRRGGSIPDDWYYVGSAANGIAGTSFTDKYSDDVVIANPSEDQNFYQLWPTIGPPATGVVTYTAGVIVVGEGFSPTWSPRTPILINGVWYTIYLVYSDMVLQTFENTGVQVDVTWEVPEPILQAQPLPCFWGPLNETMFGCGDPNNPQRLYWTNVGDADSTRLSNWIDITTPSEPLMNGVIYNGRSYVWSSERFFQIIPSAQDELGAVTGWSYVEIPNGRGLWARWAFTNPQSVPGEVLYFLSKDGIYRTDGGSPSDITAEDLRPLFPNEGNLGESVNTVPAPLMVPDAAPGFRLSTYDDYLYFDYVSGDTIITKTASFSDTLYIHWTDYVVQPNSELAFIDVMGIYADYTVANNVSAFANSESFNSWGDTLGVDLGV
jgi:hypothetical protein